LAGIFFAAALDPGKDFAMMNLALAFFHGAMPYDFT
jgi:hypothetical protein